MKLYWLILILSIIVSFSCGVYYEGKVKSPESILRMDANAFDKEVTNGCSIYTSKDGSVKVLFATENPDLEKDQ